MCCDYQCVVHYCVVVSCDSLCKLCCDSQMLTPVIPLDTSETACLPQDGRDDDDDDDGDDDDDHNNY